jgi:threonine dehydrogenase-like Zn-dependent dehydrogenase
MMSSPGDPGFFRDRLNLPAHNLIPLPRNLGFAEATLYEPVSIILHSMRFATPSPGETAVVFGAGPIGLTTIAVLRLSGISRLWAVEPLEYRHEFARQMGADAVLDPRTVDPVKEIVKETGNRGVDLAIDCATRDDTINQCLQLARSAGRVVITGVPAEVRYPIEFHTIRKKELVFHTVRRSNHNGPGALRMLSEQIARFAPMITHRRMMSEIQPTFEMIERYDDQVAKAVIYPAP